MKKPLPAVLTSYDFLKAAALLLMVVDHVGYYLYPEQQWFRAAGRFSAPIWLFLIGYARSRDLSPRLWIGMLVLVASNFVVGVPLLPVSIIGTILLARMIIDPVMQHITRNPKALYPVTAVLSVLTLVTFMIFEYGAVAMLIVMAGYIARNREEMRMSPSDVFQYACIAGLIYASFQTYLFFAFPQLMGIGVILGIIGLMIFLLQFRPYEYPGLTQTLPKPITSVIQLCGRRTLEIYVIHLLLFKAYALASGAPNYSLFDLHIMME